MDGVIGLLRFVIYIVVLAEVVNVAASRYRKMHIVEPIVLAVKERINEYDVKQQRVYDDLPELGKARVDKQGASLVKVIVVVGAGVWILILGAINPLVWIPAMVIAARWAIRNWKEADEQSKDAEERRERTLRK